MFACFSLALYSISKKYWEFAIPHVVGFLITGFVFCIVVSWTFVYKSTSKSDLKKVEKVNKKDLSSKTAESLIDLKVH